MSLFSSLLRAAFALLLISGGSAFAAAKTDGKDCQPRQYVFSWNMSDKCLPTLRGGTSKGADVTLATAPSAQWQALQQADLSTFERDRRAILAMAGGYRTSFEFVETIAYPRDYALARPYHSWGTEYIYVVEDRSDFISLQHIMVMVFAQEDGKPSAPMVMKHWRQDWHYEDRTVLEFVGHNTWETRTRDKKAVQGQWSQSVYQVDDSPRYAAIGKWQHNDSFSVWQSEHTWRPLPRREHTVRDDYQVLEGINRHVILPTGWVHEEDNLKRRLNKDGNAATPLYLARELGNNRYQRIVDFDWQAGDQYWQQTGAYWAIVRQQFARMEAQHRRFTLKGEEDDTPLFMVLFQQADQFAKGELKEPQRTVAATLNAYRIPE